MRTNTQHLKLLLMVRKFMLRLKKDLIRNRKMNIFKWFSKEEKKPSDIIREMGFMIACIHYTI